MLSLQADVRSLLAGEQYSPRAVPVNPRTLPLSMLNHLGIPSSTHAILRSLERHHDNPPFQRILSEGCHLWVDFTKIAD
jgi:hypothetical protein